MGNKISLIGAGYMGREYCKVLKSMNTDFNVIGNQEAGAVKFEEETGIPVVRGGLLKNIDEACKHTTHAIVAVPVNKLFPVTEKLVRYGIPNILVEKPAGKNTDEIRRLYKLSQDYSTNIYVAYNRRFYASVDQALTMISANHEQILAVDFEFTEWLDRLYKAHGNDEEIANFFLTNSTHVLDLAFFFAGFPAEISCYNSGSKSWLISKTQYAGAGRTDKGILFSYHADWEAPGRWGVEVITDKSRYYFRPLEQLKIQRKNSLELYDVELDGNIDELYKPGLYSMVQAFAGNGEKHERLMKLSDLNRISSVYDEIEK